MYIEKGNLQKAFEFNLKAHEYNSEHPVITDNLAHTYFLIGEIEKSLNLYEKLFNSGSKPAFAEAYYNYALTLEASGRSEEAYAIVKNALDYKLSYLSTISPEQLDELIKRLSLNYD